jgi:hypothetical protein
MTATEMKEEFNLRYNNALEGAPGLDTFEISSYLTIAQEQFVKVMYDASKDPSSSFELHEKSRRVLNELVKDKKKTTVVESSRGIVSQSVFYEIGNDIMYIILETAELPDGLKTRLIKVLPTTHDEFMISIDNPFRKFSQNLAWRMDVSKEASITTVEIICEVPIKSYNIRYISYPSPIIVEDLTTAEDIFGLGLTIQGKTDKKTCLLSELAHREIINIAVENAVLDYRDGTLQSRMTMDARI